MVKFIFRRAAALLLLLLLLLPLMPAARALEDPSVRDRKGTAPAEAPWLDEQFDDDGSAYANPPSDVRFVRIGLSFGDSAVEEAVFWNENGSGFRIGVYDEDRVFQERARTPVDTLTVAWAEYEPYGLSVLVGEDRLIVYLSHDEDSLAIEPLSGPTFYGEDCYLGGFECRKLPEGRMTVVNCVDLENYVKGVVPYEMAPDWPMEALKAQAVCARTYVVYNQNAYADQGFDITDDTDCQVYRGTSLADRRTDTAVDETAGQLIRCQGELCQIYYFAADGGATEDGTWIFDADRPYLTGKRDPFEAIEDYAFRRWTRRFEPEELSYRLSRKGWELDRITSVTPEYSQMGNVIALTLVSESGQRLRLTGRDCCAPFCLPSQRFTVKQDRYGRFVFSGHGLGHNCGMSQWGARAMDEVYGYTYRQIIAFYFTGAYIA